MTQRRMSYWGWGYADKFPDKQARSQLGQMVEAILKIKPQALLEPTEEHAINIPEARRLHIPSSLAHCFHTDDATRLRHSKGRAYPDIVNGFYGRFDHCPDAVITPHTAEEVFDLLDWATEQRVAVVPYGGGTSVVGGVNTEHFEGTNGTVTLSTRELTGILNLDAVSGLAHIQAGTFGPEIETQLAHLGLTLRHYPQSFEFSTLGGWIATRAGGHFATLYTHIDDLVASTRMICPSGMWRTWTLPGSGAGPSPDRIAIGSEGSLGVITSAWMRVRKRPRFKAKANILFDNYTEAVAATRTLAQSGLHPTNCRLLDKREAMLNQVVTEPKNVLLIGFESHWHDCKALIELAMQCIEPFGGQCPEGYILTDEQATDKQDVNVAQRWKQAFFDGPYMQSTLVSMGILADTFETCCRWDRFEEMHATIIKTMREAMFRITGHKGMISCRFTHVYPDGPAPYYTYIVPTAPGRELEHWQELKQAASEVLMKYEATITHHHAVGRIHMPWYRHQRPDDMPNVWSSVKYSLDPHGIMNPGVLIDPQYAPHNLMG